MTAQTSDVYSGNVHAEHTDEIDIRRYVLVLLRWWREIFAISIVAGAIAGIAIVFINNIRTPVYAASADLLIARMSSNIELDERVVTTNPSSQSDVNVWRASLLQLVKSSTVAGLVLEELGNELPETLQSPDELLDTISAEIPLSPDERVASNLIRINAITAEPELSAKIVNAWARHLVAYINGLYGEVPQTMLDSVTAERDQSLLNYQAAENEYEKFVADSQIEGLERQIQEKITLRDELMLNYSQMLTSVISTEYNAHLQLYAALANAPADHARAVIAAQSEGNVQQINLLYGLRGSLLGQLHQARNMERTLATGGEAAAKSNISALQLLKLAAFASLQAYERLPVTLSVVGTNQPIEMSLDEQLTDVRALIGVFEDSIIELDHDIAVLAETEATAPNISAVTSLENQQGTPAALAETATYTSATSAHARLLSLSAAFDPSPNSADSTLHEAHNALLTRLEGEIATLRSAIIAEEARQQQLTHRRDLAWTTYEAVGNKLQELSVLRSSANSEVRIGSPALPPPSPMPQINPLMPVLMLTFAGFFFAVLVALLADSLGREPFFAHHPV